MAFSNSPRQMFEVDLTCAKCGNHISQLPFQPSSGKPVFCFDCNKQFRQNRPDSRGPRPQRQMYSVNLTCADCGTPITQLPFEPKGDKPVYCREHLPARKSF